MGEIANYFEIPYNSPYKIRVYKALYSYPNFIRKDTEGNIQVKVRNDWVYVSLNTLIEYLNSRLSLKRKLNNRKHYARVPK